MQGTEWSRKAERQGGRLAAYFMKMRGNGKNPLQVQARTAWIGFAGGFVAIGLLAWLTAHGGSVWLMAPFGASCVLAFGLWEAPLSQPRNIVGGHLISALTGLAMLQLFGQGIWVMAAAVGLAIAFMHLTRTTHPPAGANPLVVIIEASSWSFLWMPVLTGSLMIVLLAVLINNLDQDRQYPKFWV